MMKIGLKTSLYPHRYFTEQLMDAFRKSPWESDLNHETLSFSIRQLKNYTGASPATIHKQHEEVSHQNEWQHLATRENHATATLAAWAAAEPLVRDNVGADQNDQISDAVVNTQRTGVQEKKGRAWLTGGVKNRSAQKRQSAAQPSREPAPCKRFLLDRFARQHSCTGPKSRRPRTNRQLGAALSVGLPARKIDTCLRETNQRSTGRKKARQICTTEKTGTGRI
jgi:hypothetical protein